MTPWESIEIEPREIATGLQDKPLAMTKPLGNTNRDCHACCRRLAMTGRGRPPMIRESGGSQRQGEVGLIITERKRAGD